MSQAHPPGTRPGKVAIVGFSDTSRDLAPYDDPAFEKWGLGSLYRFVGEGRRFDRWFEVHREDHLADVHKHTLPEFHRFLATFPGPVYMTEPEERFPTAVRLPIEDLTRVIFGGIEVGNPSGCYWTNTIAYMVALAVVEGFQEIHVYGVDMVNAEEYLTQRPGVTFVLGVAVGRGIRVVLPKGCALMFARDRYGYEEKSAAREELDAQEAFLRARLDAAKQLRDKRYDELHNLDGHIDEQEQGLKRIEERRRGGTW